ncbi:MAG: hypothetical protein E7660_07260, partial [Ruminococcaceae bacterium]|nr:hypothetical protein [Oscillospiraceae bacterium]
MKRILAILLAVLMLAGTMPIYAQEAQSECEHEYFNACDGVCMNCGEVTREATHELTHVPEVVATDCLHPGNIEYYKCSKCGGYYTDEEGYEQINPWYVETSVDCVRPEDAADCAVIPCTVCGNDTYGYGEHDLGDSFACQGGTCAKCGDYIYGYGCENDGPYCTDGHCIFCGEVVEGWGHENGAWAPCTDGLCAYGCGLEYPATAEHNDADGNGICDVCYFCAGEHVFENGFDPCYGGTCSRCWAYFEGEHSYDNACDVDCNVCGENREVEHTLVHVPAVEGSCIQQGNIEYWYCEVCGSAWLDAECTLNTNLKSVVLVGASHPERYVVHVEAKPATCFEDGNIEYWYCDLCKCYFSHEYMRPYQEINVSATVLPAEHTFANPCDTYCVVCEEDVRDPNHTLTYVPCVEPVDCQTPGNIEHWYCEVCEGYFNDENGVNQLNPWYIPITADCVRPEGSADCASVNCLVCGEEIYGYGEHDLGESFP